MTCGSDVGEGNLEGVCRNTLSREPFPWSGEVREDAMEGSLEGGLLLK